MSIYWFRRDLRLQDNTALFHALNSGYPVLPIFIFDEAILGELPKDDPRVSFIYETLKKINDSLNKGESSLYVKKGSTTTIWEELLNKFNVKKVFFNEDYEPYAMNRDAQITELCLKNSVEVQSFKDQVIFETNEVVKSDGTPYKVYTPYSKKWIAALENDPIKKYFSLLICFTKNLNF